MPSTKKIDRKQVKKLQKNMKYKKTMNDKESSNDSQSDISDVNMSSKNDCVVVLVRKNPIESELNSSISINNKIDKIDKRISTSNNMEVNQVEKNENSFSTSATKQRGLERKTKIIASEKLNTKNLRKRSSPQNLIQKHKFDTKINAAQMPISPKQYNSLKEQKENAINENIALNLSHINKKNNRKVLNIADVDNGREIVSCSKEDNDENLKHKNKIVKKTTNTIPETYPIIKKSHHEITNELASENILDVNNFKNTIKKNKNLRSLDLKKAAKIIKRSMSSSNSKSIKSNGKILKRRLIRRRFLKEKKTIKLINKDGQQDEISAQDNNNKKVSNNHGVISNNNDDEVSEKNEEKVPDLDYDIMIPQHKCYENENNNIQNSNKEKLNDLQLSNEIDKMQKNKTNEEIKRNVDEEHIKQAEVIEMDVDIPCCESYDSGLNQLLNNNTLNVNSKPSDLENDLSPNENSENISTADSSIEENELMEEGAICWGRFSSYPFGHVLLVHMKRILYLKILMIKNFM